MSTYEVGYQVHPSQVRDDEWITVPMDEAEAHEWFDRYRSKADVLAVRVVRIDRTVIRNQSTSKSNAAPGGHNEPS